MRFHARHSASRGFTLVESAIVLALFGVVTAAIIGLMVGVRERADSNMLYQQVISSVKSVRNFFAGRVPPSDSNTYTQATLQTAGTFPEDICPANCVASSSVDMRNVFSGLVEYSSDKTVYTDLEDGEYYLIFYEVPKNACLDLGMKLGANAVPLGLVSVTMSASTGPASPTTVSSFPISMSTLIGTSGQMCNRYRAVTIAMRFRINT